MTGLKIGYTHEIKKGNKVTIVKVIDSNMILVTKLLNDSTEGIKVYEGIVKWEQAFTNEFGVIFYGYESTGYNFIFEEEKEFSDILTKDEVVSRLSRYRIFA